MQLNFLAGRNSMGDVGQQHRALSSVSPDNQWFGCGEVLSTEDGAGDMAKTDGDGTTAGGMGDQQANISINGVVVDMSPPGVRQSILLVRFRRHLCTEAYY